MTKAIQILSKNLTGKENILIKETKSQAIKILDMIWSGQVYLVTYLDQKLKVSIFLDKIN